MGIFTSRRRTALAAAVALVAASLAGAVPALAADKPIDITGFTVNDLVITDGSCKQVDVRMTTKVEDPGTIDRFWITTSFSGPGGSSGSAWFDNNESSSVQVCPALYGLGQHRLSISSVSVSTWRTNQYGSKVTDFSKYWDYTDKTFYARGKTKSSLTAKRSAKTVTLTAKASVYAPEKFRYAPYNPAANVQVRTGANKWKTIKSVKLSKGKATIKIKNSTKKMYRLTFPQTSKATAGTSNYTTK